MVAMYFEFKERVQMFRSLKYKQEFKILNWIKVRQDTCGKIAAFVRQPAAASSETSFPLLSLFAKLLLMHFARSYLAGHLLLATLVNKICENYVNNLPWKSIPTLAPTWTTFFYLLANGSSFDLFERRFVNVERPLSNFHE